MYTNQKLSLVDIAENFKMTTGAISFWLKKLVIPIRNLNLPRGPAHMLNIPLKATLEVMCNDRAMSINEIAKEVKVATNNLITLFSSYGIPTRDPKETRKLQTARKIPPKEELQWLYIDQKMNLAQIARQVKVSQDTIKKYILHYGIPLL